ncbi:cytochrome c oxidase assembly factor CtaG [Lysinibacillus xylanilyticus]|uniref:cytochrome c oxidase assembly factor CtaG n=1 Tax=Lysinibacillus xylanilyticus TaxID=582475 RepID=UPI002B253221|nr:cytochrome c oxidase assembly factor CtaG [Lysinibacillus xylanilyticus]MEB2298260.1 cytochrome c oxidase assembly factor CtaG [Lysinibacillus xylanilyticus]
MPLSIFGFQALWSPYLIGVLVFITVIYFLVTTKWRKDFKVSEPLKKEEAIYFVLAMVTIYIIKGSPIDLMAHIMFTMHMVQMAILLLLVPIFLIKGIPWWVWKVAIEAPVVRSLFKVFTFPVAAVFVFIGLFSFYHLPAVLDYIKLNETLHGTYTFVLFVSAVLMYWPLIQKMPNLPHMKPLHKLAYIIANAVLITPACALIIFAPNAMYETYTNGDAWLKAMELCVPVSTLSSLSLSGPELFTNMTPVADQQLGGVLMKILQELIFGVLLGAIFLNWYRAEQKDPDKITADALKEHQKKWESQQQHQL